MAKHISLKRPFHQLSAIAENAFPCLPTTYPSAIYQVAMETTQALVFRHMIKTSLFEMPTGIERKNWL